MRTRRMGNPSRAQYRMVTAKKRQKKLRLHRSRHSAKSDSPYCATARRAPRPFGSPNSGPPPHLPCLPGRAYTRAGHALQPRIRGLGRRISRWRPESWPDRQRSRPFRRRAHPGAALRRAGRATDRHDPANGRRPRAGRRFPAPLLRPSDGSDCRGPQPGRGPTGAPVP